MDEPTIYTHAEWRVLFRRVAHVDLRGAPM
jgi:hypothetical protein